MIIPITKVSVGPVALATREGSERALCELAARVLRFLEARYPPERGFGVSFGLCFWPRYELGKYERGLGIRIRRGVFWSYVVTVFEESQHSELGVNIRPEHQVVGIVALMAFLSVLTLAASFLYLAWVGRYPWHQLGFPLGIAPFLGAVWFAVLWILSRPIVWMYTPWDLRRDAETKLPAELGRFLDRR